MGNCDAILEIRNPTGDQSEILAKVLAATNIEAYKMAKADPVLFYSLKEWQTLDKLYQKIDIFKKSLTLPNTALLVSEQAREFRNDFVTAIGSKKLDERIFTPGESETLGIGIKAKSAS